LKMKSMEVDDPQAKGTKPQKETSALLFNTCCSCMIAFVVMILCIVTMKGVESNKMWEPTLNGVMKGKDDMP